MRRTCVLRRNGYASTSGGAYYAYPQRLKISRELQERLRAIGKQPPTVEP